MNTLRSGPRSARARPRVPASPPWLAAAARARPVRPLLREEQGQVRQLRLARLQEPALRGLLLPGVRAAPGARSSPTWRARYQKVSSGLKHEIGAAHPRRSSTRPTRSSSRRTSIPTFVPEGVLAFAEPVRGPHGAAHRRAPGQAAGPHHPRADARLRVRPHPAQPHAAQHAAVDRRGPGRLHARRPGTRSTS